MCGPAPHEAGNNSTLHVRTAGTVIIAILHRLALPRSPLFGVSTRSTSWLEYMVRGIKAIITERTE